MYDAHPPLEPACHAMNNPSRKEPFPQTAPTEELHILDFLSNKEYYPEQDLANINESENKPHISPLKYGESAENVSDALEQHHPETQRAKLPPHPGKIIKKSIDELKLSVAAAACGLCITRQQLYKVITGQSVVTPEMAVRLEKGLGIAADEWLRMQAAYDVAQVRKREGSLKVKRLASGISLGG